MTSHHQRHYHLKDNLLTKGISGEFFLKNEPQHGGILLQHLTLYSASTDKIVDHRKQLFEI